MAAAAVGLSVSACQGVIGEPSGVAGGAPPRGDVPPGSRPGTPGAPGGGAALTCVPGEVRPGPPSAYRRLTRLEYDNTVRDLLGDESQPARAFPPDEDGLGFDVGATVSPLQLELYMRTAETLAASAVERNLARLVTCSPANGDDACAARFIEQMGRRVYRRPLSDRQKASLLALHRGADTFADGVRLVLQAMLQSPYFLYRIERGDPATLEPARNVVALDGYERATRLSYLFWSTTPDDELFAAAEAGRLATPDEVAEQARRLIADPRARTTMRDFFFQWLELDLEGLSKDERVYPELDDTLRGALRGETERFVDHVLWTEEGSLSALLTGTTTFVDAALADLYGIDGVTGRELVRVELDPRERGGILTLASVLATHARPDQSSPVLRGKLVRERLLCQPMPPPPEDLIVVPPDLDPGLTTRERYRQHSADPACSGCHRLMDPIGLGFEHYDALGRYRETENGLAIDATGEVFATDEANGAFDGAVELGRMLAESDDVRRCVTSQWFQYAFGRSVTTEDACSIERAQETLAASGDDLRELVVALTQTDAFLYRTIAEGEVAP